MQTLTVLFAVSDFIMIYYSFGRKIKPLRANLFDYYAALNFFPLPRPEEGYFRCNSVQCVIR